MLFHLFYVNEGYKYREIGSCISKRTRMLESHQAPEDFPLPNVYRLQDRIMKLDRMVEEATHSPTPILCPQH